MVGVFGTDLPFPPLQKVSKGPWALNQGIDKINHTTLYMYSSNEFPKCGLFMTG